MDDRGMTPGDEAASDESIEAYPNPPATDADVEKLKSLAIDRKPFYVAVDFDGTICQHQFPEIGSEVPGAFRWLRELRSRGAKLILWTMRSDSESGGTLLSDAVEFCFQGGIDFDFVNENPQPWTSSPKAYAQAYVDDTAIGCPLIENKQSGGRPYVDWDRVGPAIVEKINSIQK